MSDIGCQISDIKKRESLLMLGRGFCFSNFVVNFSHGSIVSMVKCRSPKPKFPVRVGVDPLESFLKTAKIQFKMKIINKNNVMVPQKTFAKFIDAMTVFNEVQEQIENHLIFSNKKIVGDLRRARTEHQKGKVGDWRTLKTKYGI